jgi:hypothetical protein
VRPFFTYYGGKWRIAKKYPAPQSDTIVEPFAGSAGYSLRYHAKRVVLCDLDPVLAGVWSFLIRSTPAEIDRLPLLEPGESVDDLNVCQEARWLIGFWLTRGGASPNKTMSAWGRDPRYSRQFWGQHARERVANQVDRINHWEVVEGPYTTLPNRDATWFVDPPYEIAGKHYRKRTIDYGRLGLWCRSRVGQVIVCENEGATWLPFRPFVTAKANESATGGKRSREAIWISGGSERQQCLFGGMK